MSDSASNMFGSNRTNQIKLCTYLKNCVADDRWRRAVGRTGEGWQRTGGDGQWDGQVSCCPDGRQLRDSIQLREMGGGWQQLGETGSRRARDGRALGEGRRRTGPAGEMVGRW
jgi:hypothetical protein